MPTLSRGNCLLMKTWKVSGFILVFVAAGLVAGLRELEGCKTK